MESAVPSVVRGVTPTSRGQKSVKQPILDDSFRKWGIEGHRMGVILEFDSIDRKTLREYEKICIQEFTNMGISLNQHK